MTFRVGQKVVCVDASGGPGRWIGDEALERDSIYTIHSLFIHPKGSTCVRLVEVKRSIDCVIEHGHDGYGAWRFRPVVERQTDISVFTEILRTTKLPTDQSQERV